MDLEGRLWAALGSRIKLRQTTVPFLADAVYEYRDRAHDVRNDRMGRRERLLDQANAAAAIRKSARTLLRTLSTHRDDIRHAAWDGAWPRDQPGGLTLLDRLVLLRTWDTVQPWDSAAAAIAAVERLADEAGEWKTAVRARARQKPAKKIDARLHLTVWVAVVLLHAGIQPTPSKHKEWARVMAVIYAEAPIPGASYRYKDLQRVLRHLGKPNPLTTPA
jgi:hypothetical protein